MNHSVQAYWERIPIDQLILFLENDLFTGAYAINDAILQDILYKFSIKWFKNHFMHRRCVEISMRQDFVIFHFENNKIDNAARRCLRNKTKPFYCETV